MRRHKREAQRNSGPSGHVDRMVHPAASKGQSGGKQPGKVVPDVAVSVTRACADLGWELIPFDWYEVPESDTLFLSIILRRNNGSALT